MFVVGASDKNMMVTLVTLGVNKFTPRLKTKFMVEKTSFQLKRLVFSCQKILAANLREGQKEYFWKKG